MSTLALTVEDAVELRALAASATRSSVRAWLAAAADSVQGAPPSVQDAPPSAAAGGPAAPVAVAAPVAATPPARSYIEPAYGFSADGAFVEVLLMDLNGVGGIPRAQVHFDVTATSFDLKVHDLGGKNYRLVVPSLDKEIVAGDSSMLVGKNRITLKLKKAQSYDYWTQLKAKNPDRASKASGGKSSADPMGGLMDIMKDMYEDGDDATKKMIAEAMIKSREKQPGGPAGFGGGGSGGFGGEDF